MLETYCCVYVCIYKESYIDVFIYIYNIRLLNACITPITRRCFSNSNVCLRCDNDLDNSGAFSFFSTPSADVAIPGVDKTHRVSTDPNIPSHSKSILN